jgi:acetolactate synthase-1/2/3 large subunit
MSIKPRNVGEALLLRLKQLGVDFFFANPGTEFASVIRGFRELAAELLPEPILAPHEFQAVSMAYGAYLGSGRPQAVMTHANVGAANAVIGLIAAARMNIPLIFIAGQTSVSERETLGHRDKIIHWAQEAKDQGGMYREYVKWEVEVRDESCIYDVLDRAYAIAMSEPRGPVAISISRDILVSERVQSMPEKIQVQPSPPFTLNADSLKKFFSLLADAKRPLLITNRLGADPSSVPLLVEAAERHGLGVVTPDDFYVSFPATHTQHLGFKHGTALKESDLVIVLDTDVPWYPSENGPAPEAKVVHVGPDPLLESLPLRSHRGDLFLRSSCHEFLLALCGQAAESKHLEVRRAWCVRNLVPLAPMSSVKELTAESVSATLAEMLGENFFLVNELGLVPELLRRQHPGTYFRSGSASPLGWGVGCALGLSLATPEKIAVACVGDGVFFLSPMLGALLTGAQRKIPLVVLVLNNGGLRSVANATREFYPAMAGDLPLTTQTMEGIRLDHCANFVGGWGARASTPAELREALYEGIKFTEKTRKPVIIDAVCTN